VYNKLLHNSAGLVSLTRWNCFSIIGLRLCFKYTGPGFC